MPDYFKGKESQASASPSGGMASRGGRRERLMREVEGSAQSGAMATVINGAVNYGYKLVVPAGQNNKPSQDSPNGTVTVQPGSPASPSQNTGNLPTIPEYTPPPAAPASPTEPAPVWTVPPTPVLPAFPVNTTVSLSKPVFTKPVANSTGLKITLGTALEITANTGTTPHVSTDWEARRTLAGILSSQWSSYQDTVNKLAIIVPGLTLTLATTYYLRARYRGPSGAIGPWSDEITVTTSLT